MSVANNI